MQEIFPNHAKNLSEFLDVLDDYELKTLYDLLNKIYKEKRIKMKKDYFRIIKYIYSKLVICWNL